MAAEHAQQAHPDGVGFLGGAHCHNLAVLKQDAVLAFVLLVALFWPDCEGAAQPLSSRVKEEMGERGLRERPLCGGLYRHRSDTPPPGASTDPSVTKSTLKQFLTRSPRFESTR